MDYTGVDPFNLELTKLFTQKLREGWDARALFFETHSSEENEKIYTEQAEEILQTLRMAWKTLIFRLARQIGYDLVLEELADDNQSLEPSTIKCLLGAAESFLILLEGKDLRPGAE